MALSKKAFQLAANADLTLDTDYRLGNKPPGTPTLAWGSLSALAAAIAQQNTGTPFSFDVRALLTGTAAGTATITIISVPGGDDAATEGWSIENSDDFEHPGDNAGNGFLRLRATESGNSVDTDILPWSWTDPVLTDALGPGQITGLVATPYEGGVTLTFDPAIDPVDGINPASLIKEYRIRRGSTLVHTEPATQAVSIAPQMFNVGAVTPTPSATQSGRRDTIRSSGSGFDSTADQLGLFGWQHSGGFLIKGKVHSLTADGSVHNAAPGGLQCRETLDPGAKQISIYQQRVSSNQCVEAKRRLLTDQGKLTLGKVDGTNTPRYVRIVRPPNSDEFTLSYSSDGGPWSNLAVHPLPMSQSVYVGAVAAALVGDGELVMELDDLTLTPLTSIEIDIDTSVGGTWTVEAVDNEGNVSPVSLGVAADPLPVTSTPQKWNPGYYIRSQEKGYYNASEITELASMPNVTGWVQLIYWGQIETSKNVYNWTFLDTLYDRLAAIGKRLIVHVWPHSFGSANPGIGGGAVLPGYLRQPPNPESELFNGEYGSFIRTNNGGLECCLFNSAVVDRWILLLRKIGERYNKKAYFEGAHNGESAYGSAAQADAEFPSYSETSYYTQSMRLAQELKPYYLNSNFWLALNYGFNASRFAGAFQILEDNKVGYTAPDTYVNGYNHTGVNADHHTPAQRALRGWVWNGSVWIRSGGKDFRTRIPIAPEFQGPAMGGSIGGHLTPLTNTAENPRPAWSTSPHNMTLRNICLWGINELGTSHIAPLRKKFAYPQYGAAGDDYNWDTTGGDYHATETIKGFLNGTPPTPNQNVPTCYAGLNVITGGTTDIP